MALAFGRITKHFSISTSDTGSISGRLWKTIPRSGRAYPEPWPLCFRLHGFIQSLLARKDQNMNHYVCFDLHCSAFGWFSEPTSDMLQAVVSLALVLYICSIFLDLGHIKYEGNLLEDRILVFQTQISLTSYFFC